MGEGGGGEKDGVVLRVMGREEAILGYGEWAKER